MVLPGPLPGFHSGDEELVTRPLFTSSRWATLEIFRKYANPTPRKEGLVRHRVDGGHFQGIARIHLPAAIFPFHFPSIIFRRVGPSHPKYAGSIVPRMEVPDDESAGGSSGEEGLSPPRPRIIDDRKRGCLGMDYSASSAAASPLPAV